MLTFGMLVLGVTATAIAQRCALAVQLREPLLAPPDYPPAHRQRPAGRRLLALTLVLITHDAPP